LEPVITHAIRKTVGLLWTSDQPVAETSTYTVQHNIQTSMPPSGIRTRDPSNQAAADLRLRQRSHFDRQLFKCVYKAEPWLKRLVAGLSPRRTGFAPGSVDVGILVDKVALGQCFIRVLRVFSVNIILPLLHTHLSPPHEVCESSDHAAHDHTLGPKLGASSLTWHFAGTEEKRINVYTKCVIIEVITLMMETVRTSQTSVYSNGTTQRYIP
jgi:hypothetical protein